MSLFVGGDARAQGKPAVVITNLVAQYGLDPGLAVLLTDQLAEHARRSGAFSRVMAPAELETVVGAAAAAQMATCDSEGCLVELAGGLGVDYILRGSLGRIGQSYVVTARLISMQKVMAVATVSERIRGDSEEVILDAVPPVMNRLLQQAGLIAGAPEAPPVDDAAERAAEQERAARAERERVERERLEAEREALRQQVAREQQRAEQERLERERLEQARVEAERRRSVVPSPPPDDVTPASPGPGVGRTLLSTGCTVGTAGVVGIPIVMSPIAMIAGFALGIWGFVQWVQDPGFFTGPFFITIGGAALFAVGLAMFLVPVFVLAPAAGKILNAMGLMNPGVASAINSGVSTLSFGLVRSCL